MKRMIGILSTVLVTGSLLVPNITAQAATKQNERVIEDVQVQNSVTHLNKFDFISITQNDDGKIINLPVGQMFSIKLPENPSTGYVWGLSYSGSNLSFVSDQFTHSKSHPEAVGVPGIHTFLLKTIKPGITEVQCNLKRPWEAKTIKTFSIWVKTR